MASMMKHTYNGKSLETYKKITETQDQFYINQVYNYNDMFLWFVNSSGYMHIYKVKNEKYGLNNSAYYYLVEYILKDNDKLQYKGDQLFSTKQERAKRIRELLERRTEV